MTALSQDRKSDQFGTPDVVYTQLLSYPVEASTKIFGGAMVALNAAGNAVPASSAPTQKVVGRCERLADNSSGAAGAIKVTVRRGAFYYACGAGVDAIAAANAQQLCYASDDNTVNLTDAGGQRPAAGVILAVRADGQVAVQLGQPSLYAVNPEIGATLSNAFKARFVATSIAAYTGSGTGVLTETANGALAAQDGGTPAVGDILLLPTGLANVSAVDAGPWQVTSLGSAGAKFVLTRPDWWFHGAAFPVGTVIELGGEGSVWKAVAWKSTAAAGVVDTNDPLFYPREVTIPVTLAAGVIAVTSVPILSATKTAFSFSRTTGANCATSVAYNPTAITPGMLGTATVTLQAQVAAGTIQNTDTSVGNLTITNC